MAKYKLEYIPSLKNLIKDRDSYLYYGTMSLNICNECKRNYLGLHTDKYDDSLLWIFEHEGYDHLKCALDGCDNPAIWLVRECIE